MQTKAYKWMMRIKVSMKPHKQGFRSEKNILNSFETANFQRLIEIDKSFSI